MPTGQLAENEKLLYRINLKGTEKTDKEKIEALYQQRPNTKLLGSTPYLSIYYFGKKFWNPEKVEKQIQKQRAKYNRKIEKAGTDKERIAKLQERKEEKLDKLQLKKKEGNWFMRRLGEPPAIYDT
ncbi:MAG: hypothetical protein LPK19_04545, partial [Hymenobacteraceae bacterium]|nr:hypothetical protein [Hymenobacteraceae bacterium]MDX5395465.1 hypothetical protein [Hymenobacteraceae bacterium]MDX5511514.1 hypothetical protein [Hymenobacteraceae bacterium]